MTRHTMNPAYGRMLERAEAEGEERPSGRIRRLEIEPVGEERFRVVCEYEGGRHTRQELDAEGVRSKVGELVGEEGKSKGALSELAELLPENPKKVSIKVKAKAGEESEDEE